MGCKIVIFLGISLAILIMITSEVAGRDLAEISASVDTTKQAEETNGVNDEAKYPGDGYGGYPGGGNGGYPGGRNGGYPGGGRGGNGRGYCRYGCCRRNYNGGGCRKCCGYAGQAMDAEP